MKKVTITVVVRDEEADMVSKDMERSHIAQDGVYTLACGHIEDLTPEELEEVKSQVPPEILGEDEEGFGL